MSTLKTYYAILFSCLNASLIVSVEASSHKPWSKPDWGFSNEGNNRKFLKNSSEVAGPNSLIFDREAESFRPYPVKAYAQTEAGPAKKPYSEELNVGISNIQTKDEGIEASLEKNSLTSAESKKIPTEATSSERNPAEWVSNLKNQITEPETTPASNFSFINIPKQAVGPRVATAQLLKKASPKNTAPKPQETQQAQEPIAEPTPEVASIQEQKSKEESVEKYQIPPDEKGVAKLYLVSEEGLWQRNPKGIPGAVVHWISENSEIEKSVSDENGIIRAPEGTMSMRYVIQTPGFLPAVGYAIGGLSLPVVLFPNSRLISTLTSTRVNQDPDRSLVFGKIVTKDLKPISRMAIEATDLPYPFKVFYTQFDVDIFVGGEKPPRATGPMGTFFISGFGRGTQYLLPTFFPGESDKFSLKDPQAREWPATILDGTNLPPAFSVTLVEPSRAKNAQFEIVDAEIDMHPKIPIPVVIGGSSAQPSFVNRNGFVDLELTARNSIETIDIQPGPASGYKSVWLNGPRSAGLLPKEVYLYRKTYLQSQFGKSDEEMEDDSTPEPNLDVDLEYKGLVLGKLREEKYRRTPLEVRIYGYDPGAPECKILTLNDSDRYREGKLTHPDIQEFAIANLRNGEYTIELYDPKSKRIVGRQAVRTRIDTATFSVF